MLWRCGVVARDAATLWRCGAARDATTLRRCSSRCYDAATLQLAMLRRYGAVIRDATALWHYSSRQRWTAAHYATMASDARARKNGSEQRWQAAAVEIFVLFFFFTRQFLRENESKAERKEAGLRNLFLGSIGWQAPSCQRQLPSTVVATVAPSSSNNTSSTSNTSNNTSNISSSNDNLKTHR